MTVLAVNYRQGVEDAWRRIATAVPKFLLFLVILLVGYFVAKAVAKLVDGVLERVGFDRMVERGGIKEALARSKYDASDIVGKLVFWGLFLITLSMAFGVFGNNPVSDYLHAVIAYLPLVFVAILIVVVAMAIAAAVKDIVGNMLGGLSYGKTVATGASIAIAVFGVFAALNVLHIAPAIVNGLYYAMLAIVVGVTVIAVGGGGIQPMRQRWERALTRVEQEGPKMKQQLSQPYPAEPRTVAMPQPAQAGQPVQQGGQPVQQAGYPAAPPVPVSPDQPGGSVSATQRPAG